MWDHVDAIFEHHVLDRVTDEHLTRYRVGPASVAAVLMHQARKADAQGQIWWSSSQIAEALRMSDRTVRRVFSVLVAAGLWERQSRAGKAAVHRLNLIPPDTMTQDAGVLGQAPPTQDATQDAGVLGPPPTQDAGVLGPRTQPRTQASYEGLRVKKGHQQHGAQARVLHVVDAAPRAQSNRPAAPTTWLADLNHELGVVLTMTGVVPETVRQLEAAGWTPAQVAKRVRKSTGAFARGGVIIGVLIALVAEPSPGAAKAAKAQAKELAAIELADRLASECVVCQRPAAGQVRDIGLCARCRAGWDFLEVYREAASIAADMTTARLLGWTLARPPGAADDLAAMFGDVLTDARRVSADQLLVGLMAAGPLPESRRERPPWLQSVREGFHQVTTQPRRAAL